MATSTSEVQLNQITAGLAMAWERVDAEAPMNRGYDPGVGPFDERDVVRLLSDDLARYTLDEIGLKAAREVPYGPSSPLDRCDLCIGNAGRWQWAIEVKVARMFRNNGDLEPAAVSHILSPYDESAMGDCLKVLPFTDALRRAVIIIGYDYDEAPLEILVRDFETLASLRVQLGPRAACQFSGAVHPYHRRGSICGWQILDKAVV